MRTRHAAIRGGRREALAVGQQLPTNMMQRGEPQGGARPPQLIGDADVLWKGRFCCSCTARSPHYLPPQSRQRLAEIHGFFAEDSVVRSLILQFRGRPGKNVPSLRVLDWFVTNYSKKTPHVWKVTGASGSERLLDVHNEYRSWLRTWKRRHFDPFQRRARIFFFLDGTWHSTTVGQLNFMMFSKRTNILAFLCKPRNLKLVEQDMVRTLKQAKKQKLKAQKQNPGQKIKRVKLTSSPRQCVVVVAPTVFTFD